MAASAQPHWKNKVERKMRVVRFWHRLNKGVERQDKGVWPEAKEGRFRLDIGEEFFHVRMVRLWHRMPREVVGSVQGQAG